MFVGRKTNLEATGLINERQNIAIRICIILFATFIFLSFEVKNPGLKMDLLIYNKLYYKYKKEKEQNTIDKPKSKS